MNRFLAAFVLAGAFIGGLVGAVNGGAGPWMFTCGRIIGGIALGAVFGYSFSLLLSFGKSPIARYARPPKDKDKKRTANCAKNHKDQEMRKT